MNAPQPLHRLEHDDATAHQLDALRSDAAAVHDGALARDEFERRHSALIDRNETARAATRDLDALARHPRGDDTAPRPDTADTARSDSHGTTERERRDAHRAQRRDAELSADAALHSAPHTASALATHARDIAHDRPDTASAKLWSTVKLAARATVGTARDYAASLASHPTRLLSDGAGIVLGAAGYLASWRGIGAALQAGLTFTTVGLSAIPGVGTAAGVALRMAVRGTFASASRGLARVAGTLAATRSGRIAAAPLNGVSRALAGVAKGMDDFDKTFTFGAYAHAESVLRNTWRHRGNLRTLPGAIARDARTIAADTAPVRAVRTLADTARRTSTTTSGAATRIARAPSHAATTARAALRSLDQRKQHLHRTMRTLGRRELALKSTHVAGRALWTTTKWSWRAGLIGTQAGLTTVGFGLSTIGKISATSLAHAAGGPVAQARVLSDGASHLRDRHRTRPTDTPSTHRSAGPNIHRSSERWRDYTPPTPHRPPEREPRRTRGQARTRAM